MAKLSDITQRENCFFTVDGHVLRNIKDVMDYLLECSETNYAYHVNAQKNDFASWINDVLLCPTLSKLLLVCRDLAESREAVMKFLNMFDYRSKMIPDEKAFHTVDGYVLKNIHELYYYINNCGDGSFNYHFNAQKNDFANWIGDVLEFSILSGQLRSATSRNDVLIALKGFLLNSFNNGPHPEHDRYINERMIDIHSASAPQPIIAPQSTSSAASSPVSQAFIQPESPVSQDAGPVVAPVASPVVESVPKQDKSVEQSTNLGNTTSETVAETVSNNGEEVINLKPLDIERKDDEDSDDNKDGVMLNTDSFRQFTDEELEKFTSFIRSEKSEDVDVKTEYLKSVLQELKNMLKELRRAEKDPFIAELLLRNVSAKVDYYAQSRNLEDYNHIIRLMRDVQKEIEECSSHNTFNLAEEIMKDLKLQGITLKKS